MIRALTSLTGTLAAIPDSARILLPASISSAANVTYTRADHQHELPAHVTVLADAVRLGHLGQRERLRDREREAPGFDQLADLGERVDRAAGVAAAEPHPVFLR